MADAWVRFTDYSVNHSREGYLGGGTYGDVYLGKHNTSSKDIAAKYFYVEKREWNNGEHLEEARLLLETVPPHVNIITVHDICCKDRITRTGLALVDIYIIMEFCDGGDLRSYAEQNSLSLEQKLNIMSQISAGVNHLHSNNPPVTHRDIKDANVLVKKAGLVIKLADFGFAKVIEKRGDKTVSMNSAVGSRWYLAPEQIRIDDKDVSYGKPVDIFSMGLVFLALMEVKEGSTMEAFKGNNNARATSIIINCDQPKFTLRLFILCFVCK